MDFFTCHQIINEISTLSSYLHFGHENLVKFRQNINIELNESVKKLRRSESVQPEISDDEIIFQSSLIDFSDEMLFTQEYEQSLWLHVSAVDESLETANEYDNTFYATVIILLYSCIERGLIKICNLPKEKSDQGVITQVRNILSKRLDHKIDSTVWKELNFIRLLRNVIVHSGMSLELDYSQGEIVYDSFGTDALVDARPDLIEYLKLKNIYTKEVGLISLNLEYCKYAIEFANIFFVKLANYLRDLER